MARRRILFDSILNGQSETDYFFASGEYNSSIAIDPDLPVRLSNTNFLKGGGMVTPIAAAKKSSTNINDTPIAILTNPKNNKLYTVLSNGRLISYDSVNFTNETLIGTVTGSVANGAAYYNNYIYITTDTDVSRYGPLDGTPSITNNFWTSTLGLTALEDTTYPTFRSVTYPKHWMHVHTDNQLYFCDVVDGQGVLHAIKTTKTTDEGDTDDGSAYNVLDLPFNYLPTSIESYGTNVVIAAMQTSDTLSNQGTAALFFWNPTDPDSFFQQVPVNEPIVSALYNKNGELMVFSGNVNRGYVVGRYTGGFTIQQIDYFEEGYSPFPGAVDSWGDRVIWGSALTSGGSFASPTSSAVVFSLGYKNSKLNSEARHCIANISATPSGENQVITAIKYITQDDNLVPKPAVGWGDGTNYGIDQSDTSQTETLRSVWRTETVNVGQNFTIEKIRIPLRGEVDANTQIEVTISYDDFASETTLTTISNANFSGESKVVYKRTEIQDNSGDKYQPDSNFHLRFTWANTKIVSIILPIEIIINTIDD